MGAQAVFQPEPDERALWARAADERTRLERAAPLHADAALDGYLDALAARLLSPAARAAGAPPPRVRVRRDPGMEAVAWPDGHLLLDSGLVARLESEGQLAAVLAHELAHVERRHALAALRSPGGVRPAGAPDRLAALGFELTSWLAHAGHGTCREREADAQALERLAAAGFDPREAARARARLVEATGAASAHARRRLAAAGRRPGGPEEAVAPAEPAGAARFAALTRALRIDNARLEARAGGFDPAREQLARLLAAAPDDPAVHLAAGEVERLAAQRAGPERAAALRQRARAAFERALARDPARAEAFRELGLLHYEAGDPAAARAAFERYLALRPEGPEARRVREYLGQLGR
jgi:predicted Zn-dependent protease